MTPSQQFKIQLNSNGLAIWYGFTDITHINVNNDHKSAMITKQCCRASKEIEEIRPYHTCPERPPLAASQVALHFQSPLHCPFIHAQWGVPITYTGASLSLCTSESSAVCH